MDRSEVRALLEIPLDELILKANAIRRDKVGIKLELCNIMNAKSGLCGEDCKFCAQSLRHKTHSPRYSLKSKDEMVQAARRAKEIGSHRFDIVTSGATLNKDELDIIISAVSEIKKKVGIDMCASLGKLDERDLVSLKRAGF